MLLPAAAGAGDSDRDDSPGECVMCPYEDKRWQVVKALQEWHALRGRVPLTVGELMTPSPSCLPCELPLIEVVRMFHHRGFRHFLVTDAAGKLCGIVSDRDVLRWLGPAEGGDDAVLERTPVSAVMSTDLVTTALQTPAVDAVRLMIEQGISSLPVLSDGVLVGILTSTDLHVLLATVLEAWYAAPVDGPTAACGAVPAVVH